MFLSNSPLIYDKLFLKECLYSPRKHD